MSKLDNMYNWMKDHPYKTAGIVVGSAVLPAAGVLGYAALTAPWYVAYIPGTIFKTTMGLGGIGSIVNSHLAGSTYAGYVGSLAWTGKPAATAAYGKAFVTALPKVSSVKRITI